MFYTWVMAHKNDYDGTGIADLIEDMRQDRESFPRTKEYQVVRDYLEASGACPSCLECFDTLWDDYRRDVRS